MFDSRLYGVVRITDSSSLVLICIVCSLIQTLIQVLPDLQTLKDSGNHTSMSLSLEHSLTVQANVLYRHHQASSDVAICEILNFANASEI